MLYYARAVAITVLLVLGTIAYEQSQVTKMTKKKVSKFLDYLTTKPNAKIRVHASSMVLNINLHTSYMYKPRVLSHVSGHFFLGDTHTTGKLTVHNNKITDGRNLAVPKDLMVSIQYSTRKSVTPGRKAWHPTEKHDMCHYVKA